MKLLIKNGHVVDPANNIDKVCDILIKDTKIIKLAKNINDKTGKTIDAKGKIVMPGIVDMHVHLREPGREDKETVASGTKAALKGGVTSVLAMPNTTPTIDCAETIKSLQDIIKKTANVNVFIAGAITKDRLGRELNDIAKLKMAGAIAITDDGSSVDDDKLLSEALKKAKSEKLLVICHCEDKTLSKKGVVNLGIISTILGLRGISKESEYKRIQRDINLAAKINASIHIAHVSCKESVEIIAKAKKKGVCVSAETAPHYFSLDETALLQYDTNMKINPPLRSRADLEAIKQGLKNGTIDAIASDHAPHTENEKDVEFDRAEFGTIGLETELAISITELIEPGVLSWPELVEKLTCNPARILNIDKGTLSENSIADITIIDPDKEWVLTKDAICSKSKNSCFIGRKLKGRVEYTILSGKVVYKSVN
ncbi:MAG: dihydroorotase [Candidatus Omnitrophica bacterium]|nr:dihydroorotase [Candidatus Omnitrophota bacterium]